MPILSAAQKATLAARLAQPDCAGLSDQAACDTLNTPLLIQNPTPQGQVPNTVTLDPIALIGLLSPATLTDLESAGLIGPIDDAVRAGDHVALFRWLRYLGQRQKITADEATALTAALAEVPATVPDPDWTATVHGPSWSNTWAPGVEFTLPEGHSVINHVVPAIITEARS